MVLRVIWQLMHLLIVVTLKMFILHLMLNLMQNVMVTHSRIIQHI